MGKHKTDDYTNLDDVIGVLIPAGKPPELIRQPKRGKDIKCFADLPPEEQEAMTEGGLTKVTGKPGDADYDGVCTPEWRQSEADNGQA